MCWDILYSDILYQDNILSKLVGVSIIFLTDAALSFCLSFAWPDSLIVSSSSKCNWSGLLTRGFHNWLGYTSVILTTCLPSCCRKTHKPLKSSKQSCVHCAASFTIRINSIAPLCLTPISDTSWDSRSRQCPYLPLHTHGLLNGELSLLPEVIKWLVYLHISEEMIQYFAQVPFASQEIFFSPLWMWNVSLLIEFRLLSAEYQQSLEQDVEEIWKASRRK